MRMKKITNSFFGFQKKTVAFRLALKFSLLVAFVILLFSTAFVFFLNKKVREQQFSELINAARQISRELQFIPSSDLPFEDEIKAPLFDVPPPKLFNMKENQGLFEDEPTANREKIAPPLRSDPSQQLRSVPLHSFTGEIPYYITFSIFSEEKTNPNSENESIFTNDPFLPRLPLTNHKVLHYYEKDYYLDGALDILYYAEEVQTNKYGKVVIQTSLSMDNDFGVHFLSGAVKLSIVSFIPLIFLSFFIVYLITRRTMKPVIEISKTAQKISSANLVERLPCSGNDDEIDNLAKTFNALFLRINNDFDREKQFTSDVSHELRTPLAVILGHANLLRRWGKDDPAQLEKSLTMLVEEVHSMESIIENLLQISRLDSSRIVLNFEAVSLFHLSHRLKEDTNAWSKDCDFIIDNSLENYTVFTDKELLYQACTIIVSNSVKFFPLVFQNPDCDEILAEETEKPKLCVLLSAKEDIIDGQKQIAFSISDNGPGISPEVLPHVFERFYRGDPSHNRDKGGSGLGLSIVKSIMSVLKGSVFAESDLSSGTKITLFIPCCTK